MRKSPEKSHGKRTHQGRPERKPDTPLIRDAIVQAAIDAGNGDMVNYLRQQAEKHPSAFLTLLGKVLPLQVTGVDGEVIKTRIEFSIVDPKQ